MTIAARLEKPVKILLILSAVIFLYHFIKDSYEELFLNPVHFFDDAYMFIRYAKIWHLGYGESWNIGEGPVYGNTSQLHFLFVLLLTSIKGITDDAVIRISSFLPSLLFLVWLPWFCARHSQLFATQTLVQRFVLWMGIICPLVYYFTPFGYHDLTGMDTALSILMHLLLIDAVLSYALSRSRTHLIAIIVLTYLAFLTRPENMLTASLLVVLYLWWTLKDRRAFTLWGGAMVALLMVDSVAKSLYFGDVLPLAFYAKKSGFIQGNAGAGFSHPAYYFFYFLLSILPFVAWQLFSLNRENAKRQLSLVLPAIITLGYFFTMMTVMNMHARYFYPFTVYFIAAAVVSTDANVLTTRSWLRWSLLIVYFSLTYVALTLADQQKGDIVHGLMDEQTLCDDSLKTPVADFGGIGYRVDTEGFDHVVDLLSNDATTLTVAMTENGYIGAKLPALHIIDMTGLHTPLIARHGFSAAWLLAQKPDVIWMPHWHYTCMNHDLLVQDVFWHNYRFYPGVFTWGIALRIDSIHYDALYRKLDAQVQVIYPNHPLATFEKRRPE